MAGFHIRAGWFGWGSYAEFVRSLGAVGYWPLDETSGAVAADKAAHPALTYRDTFVTDGIPTRAPTGQMCAPSQASGGLTKLGGKLIAPNPGVGYLQVCHGAQPRRFGGKVSWVGDGTAVAAGMACYPKYAWGAGSMLHCWVSQVSGMVEVAVVWPTTVQIATPVWATPLKSDGTVYDWAMEVDGDTVSIWWPDGSFQQVSHPGVSDVTGKFTFYEPTKLATSESRWHEAFAEFLPGTQMKNDIAYVGTGLLKGTPGLVGDGKALNFDGSGGGLLSDPSETQLLRSGNTFSYSFVCKPAALATYQTMYDGGDFWMLANNAGGIEIWEAGVAVAVQAAAGTLVNGTKAHVVYTKDGAVNHIYVNGVDKPLTGSDRTFPDPAGYGWAFGRQDDLWPWNGLVDEVMFFNRALTAGEVSKLYAAAK